MREKPVPVRVDKELKPKDVFTPMDEHHELGEEKREEEKVENISEELPDVASKELPSMVSIVPLNKPHVYDADNIGMFQQTFQLRSKYESPDDFEFLENESVSESQKQAVKFGVRVFRDWLARQGSTLKSLEDMSRQEIANALEQFYLTARRPNGTQYKKNTLKSIKHSLDLYLRSSPLKKDFSISSDFDFRQVNRTLDNLPEDADNNRFPQCTRETILKLYKSGQLGLITTEDPQILIQTVWFYIASHFFSNIDKRMLRELTGSMLVLEKDESGQEYFWLDYKTPDRCRSDVRKARINAKVGSLCCPVEMIKKYLAHRNPRNEVLFQHPKKISNTVWYSHLPLGKNKHMDIIKVMCVNAGIHPPLTGRCIRSYIQELLRDCDQIVNSMFQLGARGTLPAVTLQTVILPKVSSELLDHSQMHQVTQNSGSHITQSQSLSGTNFCSSPVKTIVVQGNHTTGNPVTIAATDISTSSNYSSSGDGRLLVPYQNNCSTLFNGLAANEPTSHNKGDIHTSYTCRIPAVASNILGTQLPCQISLDKKNPPVESTISQERIPSNVERSTQTEPSDSEWPESAYNKADLKTRNKMRLQARKSLLSFLEELNDISDGHGTELFHEIVQEDMNMWKSIASPAK